MKVAESNKPLTYGEVLKLSQEKPEEFLSLAKGFVKLQTSAKKYAKDLSEGVQANGKILCVLKRDWLTLRETKSISVNKSFPDHYENIMGARPHNKAESCANAFAAFVLCADDAKHRITERDYDDNSAEAIQRASAIVSKVKDDFNHQAVMDAAEILKRRPTKAIAMLKAIADRIVTVVENEGTENEKKVVKYLTVEEFNATQDKVSVLDATEQVNEIAAQQPGILIAALLILAQTTASSETARSLCHMAAEIGEKFSINLDEKKARRFSAEQLEAWAAEKMPVQQVDPKAEYLALRQRLEAIEMKMEETPESIDILGEWDKEFQSAMEPVEG